MNIVLIPCWKRDDFLSVTLDRILQAKKCDQQLYIFLLDRGFDLGVLNVAEKFPLNKIVHRAPDHGFHGNTYNVLEGYKLAVEMSKSYKSDLIYLVEEDIWVGQDFFTFHENVQQQFSSFVVSAVKNQNDHDPKPSEADTVYYHNGFQSLGLSWKAENLQQIATHATPHYYRYMERYLNNAFPMSALRGKWHEQDGLINRICEKNSLKSMYAYVPRAYHAGFVGYNRPGTKLTGPLQERVDKLKTMTDDEMNELAGMHKDIRRIPLSDYGVTNFKLGT